MHYDSHIKITMEQDYKSYLTVG